MPWIFSLLPTIPSTLGRCFLFLGPLPFSLLFDSSVCLFFLLAIWLSFRPGSFYLHEPRLLPWLTTAKRQGDNCLYFILILILTDVYPPSSHKAIDDHFVRWSGP